MNNNKRQVIWLAGGDGLVGRHFMRALDKSKYHCVVLSRKSQKSNQLGIEFVSWDTTAMTIGEAPCPDHIINLAGAGIADERWTDERKRMLISSRVNSAATIEKYLEEKNIRPLSYISASAVGYYGDRSDEVLDEESAPGKEFMSECCVAWEEAGHKVGKLCQRFVIFRIGIVLSTLGGALPKMLMTKSIGIFNYFGNGQQYYPWIHIDDLARLFLSALENDNYLGVFNAVAPQEITNKEMMKEIKASSNMIGILMTAPVFALRMALGEMSNVVLNSNRVLSPRLRDVDFNFLFKNVGEAVKDLLKRKI